MNIQHLRHSLKVKWLLYYQKNRPWLVQLQIWGTYDGQRRPSSGFILATLSNLAPELTELFPFIVALSNNPDQVVAALGLNFNPDEELKSVTDPIPVTEKNGNGNGAMVALDVAETNANGNMSTQMLSSLVGQFGDSVSEAVATSGASDKKEELSQTSNLPSWVDESCHGKGSPQVGLVLSILVVIGSLVILMPR